MSSDENKDKNCPDPDTLRYEHGRWVTKDKSTKKGILLTCFIFGCFFSLLMIFACFLTKYSDDEKNGLKWFGAFLGGLFQIFVIMFVAGIIQLNAFYIIFGLLVSACIMVYVVKKYENLKEEEKPESSIHIPFLTKNMIKACVSYRLLHNNIDISNEQKEELYDKVKLFAESGELSQGDSLTDEDMKKIDAVIFAYINEIQGKKIHQPEIEQQTKEEQE